MTDAFLAAARRRTRRGMFQRLRDLGLPDDTRRLLAARAASAVVANTQLADLAAVAAAAGPLRDALAAAAPDNPALAAFNTVRDATGDAVRDLIDPPG